MPLSATEHYWRSSNTWSLVVLLPLPLCVRYLHQRPHVRGGYCSDFSNTDDDTTPT
jgi:hypothetical protein